MDAGTILFQSSGGFGPNLGQIQKELEEFGKVVRIKDTPAEDVPHQARDFDYLLEVKGILHSRYLAVRIADAGPATPLAVDSEGREVRRYAIEFLATPYKIIERIIDYIKSKYNV